MLAFAFIVLSAAPPSITVDAERLALGDVLPQAPAPWSQLDLGAAPQPGQSMWLDAQSIRRRIAHAQMEPLPVPLPRRMRVVRSLQRVDEIALRGMVQDALAEQVPSGAIRHVHVRGGAVMPEGRFDVVIDAPTRWRPGKQTVMARLESPNGASAPFAVSLDYVDATSRRGHDVQRGQPVMVRLRRAGFVVEAPGVAQESGHIEGTIAVMPHGGHKVVRARVLSSRTVEVEL